MNWDRKGALKDRRSSLFLEVPRIVALVKAAFPWAQVHFLGENVASMDHEDCLEMSKAYDVQPWFLDCDGISICHRPRLYWMSWDPYGNEGVEILWGSDGRLPIQGEAKLVAQVDTKQFVEPGWQLQEGRVLPIFTTARPSPVPGRRPAGLRHCKDHEIHRWKEDFHRYPPYQ